MEKLKCNIAAFNGGKTLKGVFHELAQTGATTRKVLEIMYATAYYDDKKEETKLSAEDLIALVESLEDSAEKELVRGVCYYNLGKLRDQLPSYWNVDFFKLEERMDAQLQEEWKVKLTKFDEQTREGLSKDWKENVDQMDNYISLYAIGVCCNYQILTLFGMVRGLVRSLIPEGFERDKKIAQPFQQELKAAIKCGGNFRSILPQTLEISSRECHAAKIVRLCLMHDSAYKSYFEYNDQRFAMVILTVAYNCYFTMECTCHVIRQIVLSEDILPVCDENSFMKSCWEKESEIADNANKGYIAVNEASEESRTAYQQQKALKQAQG